MVRIRLPPAASHTNSITAVIMALANAIPVPKAKSNEQSIFEQNTNLGWMVVLPPTMHRQCAFPTSNG
jgi:hypothetical protein